jgi:hypothetical protein
MEIPRASRFRARDLAQARLVGFVERAGEHRPRGVHHAGDGGPPFLGVLLQKGCELLLISHVERRKVHRRPEVLERTYSLDGAPEPRIARDRVPGRTRRKDRATDENETPRASFHHPARDQQTEAAEPPRDEVRSISAELDPLAAFFCQSSHEPYCMALPATKGDLILRVRVA